MSYITIGKAYENKFNSFLEESVGVRLSDKQFKTFRDFYIFLVENDRCQNLTCLLTENEVYYKHFFDSLTILASGVIKPGCVIADIGSGGGFPGVPLKIFEKDIKLTLDDQDIKKTTYQNLLINYLKLQDIRIVKASLKKFAENYKEVYDVIVIRAVFKIKDIIKDCMELLKDGGYLIIQKGKECQAELLEAHEEMKQYNAELYNIDFFSLPLGYGERNNAIIRKSDSLAKLLKEIQK
jgi:16S rRNA (guanine527-N7)-methyltransferase